MNSYRALISCGLAVPTTAMRCMAPQEVENSSPNKVAAPDFAESVPKGAVATDTAKRRVSKMAKMLPGRKKPPSVQKFMQSVDDAIKGHVEHRDMDAVNQKIEEYAQCLNLDAAPKESSNLCGKIVEWLKRVKSEAEKHKIREGMRSLLDDAWSRAVYAIKKEAIERAEEITTQEIDELTKKMQKVLRVQHDTLALRAYYRNLIMEELEAALEHAERDEFPEEFPDGMDEADFLAEHKGIANGLRKHLQILENEETKEYIMWKQALPDFEGEIAHLKYYVGPDDNSNIPSGSLVKVVDSIPIQPSTVTVEYLDESEQVHRQVVPWSYVQIHSVAAPKKSHRKSFSTGSYPTSILAMGRQSNAVEPPPLPFAPHRWEEQTDSSGRVSFYNVVTGEERVTDPSVGSSSADGSLVQDLNSIVSIGE